MTTILIDADTAIFIAALGCETNVDWPNGVITRSADTAAGIAAFEAYVARMVEVHKATAHKLAITDSVNWRKAVLPTYKSKRGPKPMALQAIRQHALENMGATMKPGLEADDVLGIWQSHPRLIQGRKVVVSIDKDLRSVPGLLSIGDGKVETIGVDAANKWHLMQTLTGDTVDGYTGLPGCGPKSALKVLDPWSLVDASANWRAVVAAFEKKGLTADDALVQARVARILRFTDFNYVTKEPILWNPPTS